MTPRPRKRVVNGIVLLDKPTGVTSNSALQRLKYLFDAAKAGHTGSLDPLATGVLPICFGEATKVAGYLLDSDKGYIAEARFGATSSTGDSEGELTVVNDKPSVSEAEVRQVLNRFLGHQQQIPPMYSALRKNGKRLYEFARAGETVEREARDITIYQLDLLEYRSDGIVVDVRCSKGTYIRTLLEDIGDALGVGAYLVALRRTSVGSFARELKLWTFDECESLQQHSVNGLDQCLLPIDAAISHWPTIDLNDLQAQKIRHGQKLEIAELQAPVGSFELIALRNQKKIIGIGQIKADILAPKRLFNL